MEWKQFLLAIGLLVVVGPGMALAEPPPLIPREVIFGNPERAAARISPDGSRLAYLAPSDKGVLNVWVRTVLKDDGEQVTNDTYRGIRSYGWSEDGKHIIYSQDQGGDENWHIYSVDLESKIVRDLTPFQGIRAEGLITDRRHPDEILVGLNLRDRAVFDMYHINLGTGAVTLDTENPGNVVEWYADSDFKIRGAWATNPATADQTLRVRDSLDAPWRDLLTLPFGENGGGLGFSHDGKAFFLTTSAGSDTTRLVKVDVAGGKELETVAANLKADVEGALVQPDTRVIQAVSFNYLKTEWTVLDPDVKTDFEALAKLHPGYFEITSRDHADKNWTVAYIVDNGPVAFFAYQRDTRKGDLLFVARPELAKYTLAKMEPTIIKARDGLELVSYLTRPTGAGPAKPGPMALNVHGGPWARDSWGYDPESQWLANRGYVVLQVNYRGSVGFGKEFRNAGNGQWGVGAMQDDLTDAVKWAIDQGIADPEKVCIYGGSYGGYATLAGLVFTPDLYACGVDIVGPSNIRTLLESIPPYWGPMKKDMVLRIGDVENDDALNEKISPLFHAANAKAPLLIGQGANDPRVNIRESDQMVKAMRDKGLDVTYIVYPDEGHGFARPENRLDFYGRVEEFLAKQLGGRAEPWVEVKGSTAEVK